MTKQVVHAQNNAASDGVCAGCEFSTKTSLFELCAHEQSKYTYDAKEDLHTIQHMRGDGGTCGQAHRLFKVRK
jgi:hypothetical protein